MKKLFLLLLVSVMLLVGRSALADNASLLIEPSITNIQVGESFDATLQLQPAGNKICLVKGTLHFDNLSCKSISFPGTFIAQTAPTCENPSFALGIPKCTADALSLLSFSVKGNLAGQAGISLSNVKLIGSGADVASVVNGGLYNISTPVVKNPVASAQKNELNGEQHQVNLFDIVAQPNQEFKYNFNRDVMIGLIVAIVAFIFLIFEIVYFLVTSHIAIPFLKAKKGEFKLPQDSDKANIDPNIGQKN